MEDKKVKKGAPAGKAKPQQEDDAPTGEIVFGAGAANEMDTFGGEDDFVEKEREPNIIHLHYQQRTTRKCITIIQGLPDDLDDKKLLRAFKKMFHCNGTIVEDEEKGMIIQLQGDFRKDLALFFMQEGIANKEEIKIHGI